MIKSLLHGPESLCEWNLTADKARVSKSENMGFDSMSCSCLTLSR